MLIFGWIPPSPQPAPGFGGSSLEEPWKCSRRATWIALIAPNKITPAVAFQTNSNIVHFSGNTEKRSNEDISIPNNHIRPAAKVPPNTTDIKNRKKGFGLIIVLNIVFLILDKLNLTISYYTRKLK